MNFDILVYDLKEKEIPNELLEEKSNVILSYKKNFTFEKDLHEKYNVTGCDDKYFIIRRDYLKINLEIDYLDISYVNALFYEQKYRENQRLIKDKTKFRMLFFYYYSYLVGNVISIYNKIFHLYNDIFDFNIQDDKNTSCGFDDRVIKKLKKQNYMNKNLVDCIKSYKQEIFDDMRTNYRNFNEHHFLDKTPTIYGMSEDTFDVKELDVSKSLKDSERLLKGLYRMVYLSDLLIVKYINEKEKNRKNKAKSLE